jgi:hypothetical protein
MSAILATQKTEIRKIEVLGQPRQIETLSQKYPTQKRAGGMSQIRECLYSSLKP